MSVLLLFCFVLLYKNRYFFPTKYLVLFPHHVLIEIFEGRKILSNNQKKKIKWKCNLFILSLRSNKRPLWRKKQYCIKAFTCNTTIKMTVTLVLAHVVPNNRCNCFLWGLLASSSYALSCSWEIPGLTICLSAAQRFASAESGAELSPGTAGTPSLVIPRS